LPLLFSTKVNKRIYKPLLLLFLLLNQRLLLPFQLLHPHVKPLNQVSQTQPSELKTIPPPLSSLKAHSFTSSARKTKVASRPSGGVRTLADLGRGDDSDEEEDDEENTYYAGGEKR
jgi:hypothetical protein